MSNKLTILFYGVFLLLRSSVSAILIDSSVETITAEVNETEVARTSSCFKGHKEISLNNSIY